MKKWWIVVWVVYAGVVGALCITIINRKDQVSGVRAGMLVVVALAFGGYLFMRSRRK